MRHTTKPLVNQTERPRGLLRLVKRPSAVDLFYQARHRARDLTLTWVEAERLGRLYCFPCVLEEEGALWVFLPGKSPETLREHDDMLRRWGEVISPEQLGEYDVRRLEQGEFNGYFDTQRQAYALQQALLEEAAAGQ